MTWTTDSTVDSQLCRFWRDPTFPIPEFWAFGSHVRIRANNTTARMLIIGALTYPGHKQ